MTPASRILAVAREQKVDAIGLSGLITPSLEEMAHVAAEMEREGFDVPLLIGGATTSRVHTAVKIHPQYRRSIAVHVNDASRAVGVVGALLSPQTRASYAEGVRKDYRAVAAAHAQSERDKTRLPLAKARANALKIDWGRYAPHGRNSRAREHRGRRSRRARGLHRLDALFPDLGAQGPLSRHSRRRKAGRCGAPVVCRRASDAERIIAEKWLAAQGGPRFLAGGGRRRRHPPLRRRTPRSSLCDFLYFAPAIEQARQPAQPGARRLCRAARRAAGLHRRFRGTAGIEEPEISRRFERANDDYSSILVKALADRFAEALAEFLHMRGAAGVLGLCGRRASHPRGAHHRKLSRHSPGPGLSRPARSYGKGDAVPRCSRPRRGPA